MSRENVELVRALAEAFQRRDHEYAFEVYDPDIVWDTTALADLLPDLAGVYHGHDGVRAYWRTWLAAWRDLEFEIADVVDAGDEVVLLTKNQRQWGRHSGIEVRLVEREGDSGSFVFTIRDGKVVRARLFPDHAAGLAAADE